MLQPKTVLGCATPTSVYNRDHCTNPYCKMSHTHPTHTHTHTYQPGCARRDIVNNKDSYTWVFLKFIFVLFYFCLADFTACTVSTKPCDQLVLSWKNPYNMGLGCLAGKTVQATIKKNCHKVLGHLVNDNNMNNCFKKLEF